MNYFKHIKKLYFIIIRRLNWSLMFVLIIGQTAVTYLFFEVAGEISLTHHPLTFFYYNMVVISTVGFGDYSPTSDAGKFIVAFWQIPSGLIVFASFISKVTQFFLNISRKNMNGSNNFSHFDDHILLLCWDPHSTVQIIDLILGDKKRTDRQILLCVTDQMNNPFANNVNVSFARLRTFSDTKELDRIAINKAARIIIDGKSDDETLSIALSIATFASKNANIAANFFDKTKAELLKMHCPHIECSVDNSAKMMVRSMQDPGSSQVTEQLLSTLYGATLYSLKVPKLNIPILFDHLFTQFKSKYTIILIGFSHFKNGDKIILNPDPSEFINTADYLHYIGHERIHINEIDWENISKLSVI